VARDDTEALQALASFPNMRVRVIGGRRFAWPEGADPTHARATIQPVRTITGLFQLRPGHGEFGVTITGDETSSYAVVIAEVSDEKLDLPVSAHLESEAIRFGSYLEGVKTRKSDDGTYAVDLAEGISLSANLLGEVICSGLRHKYPRLGSVHVSIEFGKEAVERRRTITEQFERERDTAILAESEETVDEFHLCIDCQPFSHVHVCVITPDRPPMCGRSRNEIKAGALWGADYRPWTRRDVGGADLQHTIAKGLAIDASAGEWVGIDAAVKELSGGKVDRVRIHSIGVLPHTSCGCFQALAFGLPDGGIGIMHRGYKGTAPGELTWTMLANRAGGKQSPGVAGIALKYLRSPKALCGEGGLAAVKWATTQVLEVMQPHLPAGARVATEEDALTTDELKRFLER
jgi:acetyl-CoA decarbonylase/synthase complex subunit beta